MGLNDTPLAERVHIAFFGRRNAGKSSLLNAVTSQNIAIVSDVLGTTTDPVYKSMELLPLGPVTLIDTAGIDDDGFLGEERVKKTYQVLNKTDIAVSKASPDNRMSSSRFSSLVSTVEKFAVFDDCKMVFGRKTMLSGN